MTRRRRPETPAGDPTRKDEAPRDTLNGCLDSSELPETQIRSRSPREGCGSNMFIIKVQDSGLNGATGLPVDRLVVVGPVLGSQQ